MQQKRSDTKVEFMRILPSSLLAALQYETWSPVLQKNCFFNMVHVRHNLTVRAVCHQAVVEVAVYKEELAFLAADSCDKAFVLTSGNVTYTQAESMGSRSLTVCLAEKAERGWLKKTMSGFQSRSTRSTRNEEDRSQVITSAGTTFCEAALWCRWTCHGHLRAGAFSVLAGVVAAELSKAIQDHLLAWVDCVHYARVFVQWLNDHATELNDFSPPEEYFHESLACFQQQRWQPFSHEIFDGSARPQAAPHGDGPLFEERTISSDMDGGESSGMLRISSAASMMRVPSTASRNAHVKPYVDAAEVGPESGLRAAAIKSEPVQFMS